MGISQKLEKVQSQKKQEIQKSGQSEKVGYHKKKEI